MLRVIYRSRVARHVRFADAQAIALAAADRNRRAQLTGLLLYTPSHFVQVLEGDASAVDRTMQRIARDVRHAELQIIDRVEVDAREFGGWAMTARFCAARAEQLESLDLLGALELLRSQAPE